MSTAAAPGRVYLVGAGPGDPGLITRRGLELLRQADVVLHDRLIPHELLREVAATAEVVDVGKAPARHRLAQGQIHRLMIREAKAGRSVVRLKGGDPFVFGRGGEEVEACRAAGIGCEVVPGVSSALAGPAAAGIPLTSRGIARGFAVVTAAAGEGAAHGEPDWSALARLDTVVVLMVRERLAAVAAALVAGGRSPATPAALVAEATTPRQQVVRATLGDIALAAAAAAVATPSLLVVGESVRQAAPEGGAASALAGRRVVITRPRSAARELETLLRRRGALPIACPLLRVEPRDPAGWSPSLAGYAWVVFTSRHGVRGFWRALRCRGLDARALAGISLAAIGPSAARELAALGLAADLVPAEHRVEALVAGLAHDVGGARILFPCGTRARRELADGLTAAGAEVDELEVYVTLPLAPEPAAAAAIADGVDAILFHSPTAVDAFAASGLPPGDAVLAAIGEATASRARSLGLPAVVAEGHSDGGLLATVERLLGSRRSGSGAPGCGRRARVA